MVRQYPCRVDPRPVPSQTAAGGRSVWGDSRGVMHHRKIVAVSGSGAIGWDPLDRRTWSGVSHQFFSRVQNQGRLHRAFGVEAPALGRWLLMLKNIHPRRKTWRKLFYTDTRYRDALTREVRRALRPEDLNHDLVQIGAMFNGRQATDGKTRCFTYMDSNVAESMRSPYAPTGIPSRRIDEVMAYEREVYHGMTRIFTGGRYLRDSLINDFGVPPERISVLGLGMTFEQLPRPDSGKRYDTNEILFLGAGFDRKGGWHLLRAFRHVRERIPSAVLHIVGPARLNIPRGLASGVVVHGHLRKHVPEEWALLEPLFRRCSLFTLPSLYEPFGMAPLEAMAFSIPCVVSNIQALKEIVQPGITGELVEPGDEEDLAAKLAALLQSPDLLAHMGGNARLSVVPTFTWDCIVASFFNELGTTPISAG